MITRLKLIATLATVAALTTANAQITTYTLPGLTDYDGWDNLTVVNYPGYGTFPGATPWPTPIGSNQPGSGDADFNKTAGNGYPASASIYTFGGGSFGVTDATPIGSIENVIFQIEMGSGSGGLFFASNPVLTINGTTPVTPFSSGILSSIFDPLGPFGPVTVNTFAYQWDLSTLGPVTDLSIDFSTASSAQIYAMQLDQNDTFTVVPIPEPTTYAFLALALGGLIFLKTRLRKKSASVTHSS